MAVVLMLVKAMGNADKPPFRIAVVAATNTAVDRVLEGLLDLGFTDFLRVGSAKKISDQSFSL